MRAMAFRTAGACVATVRVAAVGTFATAAARATATCVGTREAEVTATARAAARVAGAVTLDRSAAARAFAMATGERGEAFATAIRLGVLDGVTCREGRLIGTRAATLAAARVVPAATFCAARAAMIVAAAFEIRAAFG